MWLERAEGRVPISILLLLHKRYLTAHAPAQGEQSLAVAAFAQFDR